MLGSISGWILVGLGVAALTVAVFARPLLRRFRRKTAETALAQFRFQREHLEARFFDLARLRGKPRDLIWADCDWQSDVSFATDAESGLLTAFAAVNISFEAVEGGEMEEVDAVDLLRDAVAIFHYQKGIWGTGGRALFNMNPDDAIDRLRGQYVPLELHSVPAKTGSTPKRSSDKKQPF